MPINRRNLSQKENLIIFAPNLLQIRGKLYYGRHFISLIYIDSCFSYGRVSESMLQVFMAVVYIFNEDLWEEHNHDSSFNCVFSILLFLNNMFCENIFQVCMSVVENFDSFSGRFVGRK